MSETLKPCPFCGGEGFVADLEGDGWVAGCNAGQERAEDDQRCRESAIGFYADTREEAIAAWNRRAPASDAGTGPRETQDELDDAIGNLERVVGELRVIGPHGTVAGAEAERLQAARDRIRRLLRSAPPGEPANGTGGYITTHTGRQFFHADPRPDAICIEDIAHALSHLCHWGGHSSEFFSIAQHSVLVSRICPPELALWGLLHDAAEAYYGDMSRPLKKLIPEYREHEKRGMKVVAEALGLPWPEPPELKLYDNRALALAARRVMPAHALHDGFGGPLDLGELPDVDVTSLSPAQAKAQFLARYAELTAAPGGAEQPEREGEHG